MTKIMKSFANITTDEISFNDFEEMVAGSGSEILMPILDYEIEKGTDSILDDFEGRLKKVYDDTEADELATYIREHWGKFAKFRRIGQTDSVVMTGGHGMVADIVPGQYCVIDLALFSDLPPLVPKHTVIKDTHWLSSTIPGKSGKILFPSDFDRKIAIEQATSEQLSKKKYLKVCSSATESRILPMKTDTWKNCPLTEDSGLFILAKYMDNGEFHITAFRLPVRHTLYVPGGVIHPNDYLKGTWRTMLSDETDIDHVHLTQVAAEGIEQNFNFRFT
ncbi:switch-associated protein 70 [Mytilus galloprovincialis]|uniref:Switch-associated protein 70 n=1 Tax=Mytilus galloprovincialis TaxID=29158 RepID=A0A8B6GXJ1_MYTGA|nr:switch-associated protein 70 [Mytilus galloprovincialis]